MDNPGFECEVCRYWEYIHNGTYTKPEFRSLMLKCQSCNRPMRDRMKGKGIYGDNQLDNKELGEYRRGLSSVREGGHYAP